MVPTDQASIKGKYGQLNFCVKKQILGAQTFKKNLGVLAIDKSKKCQHTLSWKINCKPLEKNQTDKQTFSLASYIFTHIIVNKYAIYSSLKNKKYIHLQFVKHVPQENVFHRNFLSYITIRDKSFQITKGIDKTYLRMAKPRVYKVIIKTYYNKDN